MWRLTGGCLDICRNKWSRHLRLNFQQRCRIDVHSGCNLFSYFIKRNSFRTIELALRSSHHDQISITARLNGQCSPQCVWLCGRGVLHKKGENHIQKELQSSSVYKIGCAIFVLWLLSEILSGSRMPTLTPSLRREDNHSLYLLLQYYEYHGYFARRRSGNLSGNQ